MSVKNKKGKARPTTTFKQKQVIRNLGENGGSLRKAIKMAGYSQKYADNPQRLLSTQAWQELTDQLLPDGLLALVHRNLLENEATAPKALDLAYKLKGRYKEAEKPEQKQIPLTQISIVRYGPNKEVEEAIIHHAPNTEPDLAELGEGVVERIIDGQAPFNL